jgi:hypothetical protein
LSNEFPQNRHAGQYILLLRRSSVMLHNYGCSNHSICRLPIPSQDLTRPPEFVNQAIMDKDWKR